MYESYGCSKKFSPWPKSRSGSSELSSQLEPEFQSSELVFALSNFSTNPAKSF